MYKIAGELYPTVFHVAARSLATSALSIFGDHGDVMAVRQTGFAMLCSSTVQEVMDLSAVAHLSTYKSSVPFVNFFDGFRTSHELQKIDVLDIEHLKNLLDKDAVAKFRARGIDPSSPTVSGVAQNPDVYFQQRETPNLHYKSATDAVKHYMNEINKLRDTNYNVVNYYGAKDATSVIIIMGSGAVVAKETADYLNKNGKKTGVLEIHLYRPFPAEELCEALPKTVKNIAVLDRCKEPGSQGEPLLLDVQSALYGSKIRVIGGRYGLGSKDVTPNQIIAVFNELEKKAQKNRFTIGIIDNVTNSNLELGKTVDVTSNKIYQAKFWGFGSDGTVGANKLSIKIIGNDIKKYVQAYFSYDSKKSGGLTISNLRFGDSPINSPYLIINPDFVGCSLQSYVHKFDLLKNLKKNGTFLLNTQWLDSELNDNLPLPLKQYILDNNIQFYTIDASMVARSVGLGNRTNTIMQTAFFELANVIPPKTAISELKQMVKTAYAKKSESIVEANIKAIDTARSKLKKVDLSKLTYTPSTVKVYKPSDYASVNNRLTNSGKKFVKNILEVITQNNGDSLSVGDLITNGSLTGEMPFTTAATEKRGVSMFVPKWNMETCIECNGCSLVCPHAAIRPFLATEKELEHAPKGFKTKPLKGNKQNLQYRIQVSYEDCTGCGVCISACPSKPKKSLEFVPYESIKNDKNLWTFATNLPTIDNPLKKTTTIGSQYMQPLLEFSGACAGCGETPYVKLLTQLFGDNMVIANATGCSSIWGGSYPSCPWTTNSNGRGPAWSNSLFEDNAEYGYGIKMALKNRYSYMQNNPANTDVKEPSVWIIGGDGWGYDIGYGGIDHIIASGENVNILVMDNEVYANTGGQSSKATPAAAIAKFAADGKRTAKKDLAHMGISYGKVYVGQISLSANPAQAIKTLIEAEQFNGPSLIISYVSCISHGLKGGLINSIEEQKEAVKCGYWSIFRYNPELKKLDKNPFNLDFKNPDFSKMKEFMLKQDRFANLKKIDPNIADSLYSKTVEDAMDRFNFYKKMNNNE
jgi:pyruvate-ferredoxin/flavodoxin oxidoreductase